MFEKLQTGEKKIHDAPIEPAATFKRLQESARQSGYFLPAFFHAFISAGTLEYSKCKRTNQSLKEQIFEYSIAN